MTLTYSGSDGTSFSIIGKTESLSVITVNRTFFSFKPITGVEPLTAELKFTLFGTSGTHNIVLCYDYDVLGNDPDNPSYSDNWSAFNGQPILSSIPAADGEKTTDVLSLLSTTQDFDLRLATNKEGTVSGNYLVSVYLTENGSNQPVIEYTYAGGIPDTPTTLETPATLETPTALENPTGNGVYTETITPHDDWGIRVVADGETPPDPETQ